MAFLSAIFLAAAASVQAGPLEAIEFDAALKADAVARLGSETGREQGLLGDVTLEIGAESITEGGLRFGAAGTVRAQADEGRRGFARQVGDCPGVLADCPATEGRGLAGLLTGLHSVPGLDTEAVDLAVEAAYLYVKTGFFEVRLGRGPGAAVLEADPLPGAFRLTRADGSLVDPEGLALARTANTLSTNSAKMLIQSRRLAGFRASASYTPRADHCGVDVCRPDTGPQGPVFAEVENVAEAGLSFDHRFRASGQRWTASITAGRGEAAGPFAAAFEDPWAASARLVWSRGPVSAGLGALLSNDGVQDGDYRAWSASASYERGAWLSAIEWAAADSDLVSGTGWTLQLGASRLFENGAVAGFGLRHGEQTAPEGPAAARRRDTRARSSVFIETGLRF